MAYTGPNPLPVIAGGTGDVSLNGILMGNGTSPINSFPIDEHASLVIDGSGNVTSADPSDAGQALLSNGVSAVPTYGVTGGVWAFLQSQTISSPVASVIFNTNISSAYNAYILLYYNIDIVTSNNFIALQFSNDGGGTFATSGYLGRAQEYHYNTTATSGLGGASSNIDITVTMSHVGTGPRYQGGGCVYILGFNGNIYDSVQTVQNCSTQSTIPAFSWGGGRLLFSGMNSFRLIANSGNIAQGTFVLYGLRETPNAT